MVAIILLRYCFLFLAPHATCHNIKNKDVIMEKSPFQFLNNLQGSKQYDRLEGLHRIKEYLSQFGYLDTLNTNNNYEFDDKPESAIKTYQLNSKLDTIGNLDFRTVSTMMNIRCCVPDIINGTNTMYRGTFNTSKFEFFGNRTWASRFLLYGFEGDFPTHLMEPIGYAFDIWANKTRFNFETSLDDDYYDADLKLSYVPLQFHGRGHVLAQAFSPPDGRVRFVALKDWTVGSVHHKFDIVSIALHEIGHALGLGHSDIPDAIMFPYYKRGTVKRTLHQDDIDGINTLYGWN